MSDPPSSPTVIVSRCCGTPHLYWQINDIDIDIGHPRLLPIYAVASLHKACILPVTLTRRRDYSILVLMCTFARPLLGFCFLQLTSDIVSAFQLFLEGWFI